MKERKIARRSTYAQETTVIIHYHHRRAVGQESNVDVHEQDSDMNNDGKEKQSPTGDKSHVAVSRNRVTEDDGDR